MTNRANDRDRKADAALGEIDSIPGESDESYAIAAAAVAAAHVKADAALPPHLAARIAADADAFFARDGHGTSTTAAGAQVIVMPVAAGEPSARVDYARWGGWIAAAACLVIVVTQSIGLRASNATGAANALNDASTATDRIALHAVKGAPFGAIDAAADVTWNAHTRRGTLYPRGLPPNRAGEAYEAWIATRSPQGEALVPIGYFAVSGGARSPAAAEVLVQSPIAIDTPERVVITIERPGGVLVSPSATIVLEGAFGR